LALHAAKSPRLVSAIARTTHPKTAISVGTCHHSPPKPPTKNRPPNPPTKPKPSHQNCQVLRQDDGTYLRLAPGRNVVQLLQDLGQFNVLLMALKVGGLV
jgi:hypothetical protein